MLAKVFFYAVFFTVFPTICAKVLSLLNMKMDDEELKEKLKELKDEKFPKYYGVLSGLIVVSYIVFIIGGVFIGFLGFTSLQKSVVPAHYSQILFVSSGLSYFLFCITGLMLAICLGSLSMPTITSLSPRFWRYTQLQAMKKSQLKPMTPKQTTRTVLKMTTVICSIFLPLILLALFSYGYVHKEGVVYNNFFGLSEQQRTWDEIQKVKVTANWNNSSPPSLNLRYVLIFGDASLNLWEQDFLDHALAINNILKQHNIPFEAETLNAKKIQHIKNKYKRSYIILKLFQG